MCRDREVEAPTLVRKHKALHMVIEESPPRLGRWCPIPEEILAHARLSDVDAELQQCAVDARRSPARVFSAHTVDEVANLARDGWTPGLDDDQRRTRQTSLPASRLYRAIEGEPGKDAT
jgi:hypothetical protein